MKNTAFAPRSALATAALSVGLALSGCGGSSGGAGGAGGTGSVGSNTTAPTPVSQIKSINTSGNASHVIVVMNDNTMWSWGLNNADQLGPQASGYSIVMTPMLVSGLPGTNAFSKATVGWRNSFVHGSDVYAYGWGYNTYGVLGDGTTAFRPSPVRVTVTGGFTSIGASPLFTVAVRPDGSLWQWGSYLNLGGSAYEPELVASSGFSAVAAGMDFAIALANDGTVWTWGYAANASGQLGRAVQSTPSGNDAGTPVQIMTGVARIVAGANSGYALKTDGTLWAWGSNAYGQLGDGTTTHRPTPVQVPGVFTTVSAGSEHVAATKADGSLWTWGSNAYGQLADGTTTNALSPKRVSQGWAIVAAGGGFTLVANASGEIWGAGHNDWGELATGTQTNGATTTFTKSLFPN